MAFSSRAITTDESTAGLRTVVFGVFATADGSAKTDLSAATALIHTNGAAGTASTANFAHVSNGRYSLVLTQAEVNLSANTHLLIGPANAAGYFVSPAEVLITSVRQDANVTQIAGQTASAAGAVTFPGTVASATNITAGTITTATNVTTVNGLAANVITAAAIAADAITAAKVATDAVTEIASAVVEAEITALKTYNRPANTTATITGPTSGSTSFGVTVDASYDPIATL
jgi:hypothetical protein